MHAESQGTVRGRPREFEEADAVDALMALFWERGYDNVNQQQMAAATGMSTSSLYNAFGTKTQTFERVMLRYMDVIGELLAPLERGEAGVKDILMFIDAMEQQLDSPAGAHGCLFVTSAAVLSGRDARALELAAEHRERARQAFTGALARARGLGEAVPDPEPTARILVATFQGILGTARATEAGPEAQAQLEALRGLVRSWA
jgi:TetR/AcrR family transcriptional repressor of nem operon